LQESVHVLSIVEDEVEALGGKELHALARRRAFPERAELKSIFLVFSVGYG